MDQYGISFIGAGKVAGAFCRRLFDTGFRIVSVVSRREGPGSELAASCNAVWNHEPLFTDETDIIIVAVPDDALEQILPLVRCDGKSVIAHTAGSIGIDIFPSFLKHTGVFYPLQTFSPGRKIQFSGMPVFIEASDDESLQKLRYIAGKLGSGVHVIDIEKRRLLHVAAVFVNNFTNYMLTAGKQVAEKAGIPFETLEPLLYETIAKALENGPEDSQTGPAARGDNGTIERHIKLLSFSPEIQKLYRDVTLSIMNFYNIT